MLTYDVCRCIIFKTFAILGLLNQINQINQIFIFKAQQYSQKTTRSRYSTVTVNWSLGLYYIQP